MKHITLLVSIILFSACGPTKNSEVPAQNTINSSGISDSQNKVLIGYSAITRGSFLEIKIEDQKILVIKEQYGPDKIRNLSKKEWDILLNKIDAVDLDTLSTLEAPSALRHTDGAASARLQIIEDDLKYSTPEFDHKNPNSEIKPLVEYILSLAKTVD
ncbi:hypothetical protein [Formosa sp. PL04]|uniref:hypothetical protein n=1 Tax=Formosa sp. PL04 TaxID=3081755 RepID=UPI0029815BB4|nr:hypothetical protein [Formosa sp. PL04]MDW5289954.1 hypothetical protein [Formosa sp. PL04]